MEEGDGRKVIIVPVDIWVGYPSSLDGLLWWTLSRRVGSASVVGGGLMSKGWMLFFSLDFSNYLKTHMDSPPEPASSPKQCQQ